VTKTVAATKETIACHPVARTPVTARKSTADPRIAAAKVAVTTADAENDWKLYGRRNRDKRQLHGNVDRPRG
jgi:hypothetical protein